MSAFGQHLLIAKLSALEICGLVERHFERDVDTFVTVSVDGEQQLETEVISGSLNPRWTFREPRNLMVHASSMLGFTLYRRRRSRDVFGDKHLGMVQDKLHNFLTSPDKTFPLPNKMNWVHSRSAFLTVTLDVDYSADADRVLDQAEEKLHGAIYKTVHGRSGPMAEALSALGHSIESLDQLVNFLDGVVDIHPMCKAAWTLLSSVYKAFKSQRALDASIRELAVELKETLAHARRCKDVHLIPGAMDVVQDLARLVAECASLMDESMKDTMILRTAKSAACRTLHMRTTDCSRNLKKLRKRFEMVLLTVIHNDVAEIKEDMKKVLTKAESLSALPSESILSPPECCCSAQNAPPAKRPATVPLFPLPALSIGPSPTPICPSSEYSEAPPSMPSPSSTLSSIASFSFSLEESPTAASSQSSLVVTADEEYLRAGWCDQVVPDAPFVMEPNAICCSHGAGCQGMACVEQQGEVRQTAYQLLWGPSAWH